MSLSTRLTGPELTDTRSSRVTAARRLVKRAFRARGRQFLAEGPQAVTEALALPGVVQELFATSPAAERNPDVVAAAVAREVPIRLVSGEVFDSLAQTVTPQGVLAVCRFVDVPYAEVLAARPRLVAMLAQVRDPGNAGTVLRCADAAGADAVVLSDASVDVYNPKCVRASAGSLFHLPVAVGVPAPGGVDGLREAGVTVLAADGAGDIDLTEAGERGLLSGPTAWIFGNEAWGLPTATRALADAVVRVPVYGRAESLNLATAAAVCLYASAQAQRAPGGCRSGGGSDTQATP
ncbi:RNA methyltransferase, TrmH family [Actinopolymorpha cephalotaxi]|uniref:RNA methyltransferase, TrmH family n=1 Tax=Actinopolymorpha cephalotaxi TaxID=504797 RepID=A0A1I2TPZ8_9ACTN|nr:RNA methyltransferase [Actinopolymorpha cephalotaxi]NYH83177.1 TrmH family RNA methyltransferase [Actinopolymorpha cephalotaxi]SFG67002.1 RNA methyltransferase, TrmH family [Actinopolymorpha cephalotaxi]